MSFDHLLLIAGTACMLVALAVGFAYLLTPHLRFRGQIYALAITRRRYQGR
ncbi:hypothetical protein [Mycobacterium sp.]|uniref:hypothetical protein n=1 Tax=Mycobacterium sp. TaxID=1785 RepID=UPI002D9606C4|nr:hypothetical protein [Mycobacterium sp.]